MADENWNALVFNSVAMYYVEKFSGCRRPFVGDLNFLGFPIFACVA